jgi:hypothetical protein
MLIGDQHLTPERHRLRREQMGIPPIPPHHRVAAEQVPFKPAFNERGVELPYVSNPPPQPQEVVLHKLWLGASLESELS